MGLLGDRIGGRRTALIGLALTIVPLVVGWQFATTLTHFYVLGLFLGIAGFELRRGAAAGRRGGIRPSIKVWRWASPAPATRARSSPRCSRRASPSTTAGPPPSAWRSSRCSWRRSSSRRWRKRQPATTCARRPSLRIRRVCRESDTWWLAGLYSLTFGGFVGLASFLTTFFHEQYHLSRVSAGDFTTLVVVAGSLLRPVGGWLSDRVGGYRAAGRAAGGVRRVLRRCRRASRRWRSRH